MTDLSKCYSGGFFLIRANNPGWPQWAENDLLPDKVISLSSCICPKVSVHWGWIPGDKEAALRFGIQEAQWDDFLVWSAEAHPEEIDIWSVFTSLKVAQDFVKRFDLNIDDMWLVEIGLPHELEINFHEDGGEATYGVEKRILRHLSMLDNGLILGYEVVSFDYGLGHSWLCNYLETEMFNMFNIRPNQYGLIDNFGEAKKSMNGLSKTLLPVLNLTPMISMCW